MAKSGARRKAEFIEAMECLPVAKLPEGAEWTYEIKLDGYRLQAVKSGRDVTLYSRRRNVLNDRFPHIAAACKGLPDDTVIDGELVAVDRDGRPDFNMLQNFRSAEARIHYYAFDILVLRGRSLLGLPLAERRNILSSVLKPNDHVALSQVSNLSAKMLKFVKKHRIEGLIAKRSGSIYQPGKRTGLWCKYRINIGQEFVIGGYIPSYLGLDSIVVGFYEGTDLIYAARVRAGFIPKTRREVFEQINDLESKACPFVNLPERTAGRWGQGLTARKMKECVWIKPEAVARIDFLEWTGANHLRHTKFVGMQQDKDPRKVVREM